MTQRPTRPDSRDAKSDTKTRDSRRKPVTSPPPPATTPDPAATRPKRWGRWLGCGGCLSVIALSIVLLLSTVGILPPEAANWASTNIARIIAPSTTTEFTVVPPTANPGTVAPNSTAIPRTRLPSRPLSWATVYFTDPATALQRSILDTVILPALTRARKSIDIASFDLNLPPVVQALIDAQARGVQVRVVADDDHGATILAAERNNGVAFDAIKTLRAAQVPFVDGGRSNGLMHNKIIIIDGATLFTGSWNVSYNDTFRNNNNLLRITEARLIANYQAEFDDMFVNKQFGARSKLRATVPVLTIDGTPVENFFAPRDRIMDKIVQEANKARRSIRFMIFTFTDVDLGKQLIAQAKLGVQVQGVVEVRGASQGQLPVLFCARQPLIDVKTDGNPATMHHKVLIIDAETVVTGSYNFTRSADTINDDALLVIRSPALAAQYLEEFNRIFAQGKTPEVKCG
jgi:phosphatidylserine/phosphatidylglycerophosphate/cardiolipin synthase-like enzyme